MKKLSFLLLGTSLLSSCMDMRTVRNQTVIVETPLVDRAECDLTDDRGNRWYVGETPGAATVTKGYGPLTVDCYKKGYKRTIVQIEEGYPEEPSYRTVASSTVGAMRDVTSSIGKQYPERIVVVMEPKKFASEQEEMEWRAIKDSFERMYREKYLPARYREFEKLEVRQQREAEEAAELERIRQAAERVKAEYEQRRHDTDNKAERIDDYIKRLGELRQQHKDLKEGKIEGSIVPGPIQAEPLPPIIAPNDTLEWAPEPSEKPIPLPVLKKKAPQPTVPAEEENGP